MFCATCATCATCCATPLQDKLHETLHSVTAPLNCTVQLQGHCAYSFHTHTNFSWTIVSKGERRNEVIPV